MVADIANTGVAAEELRQFVERVERLEEEIRGINDDKRDIYAEAKGRGFDVKAIKAIVRLRAKEPQEREEEEAILELYMSALGMSYSVSSAPPPVRARATPERALESGTGRKALAAAIDVVQQASAVISDELGW